MTNMRESKRPANNDIKTKAKTKNGTAKTKEILPKKTTRATAKKLFAGAQVLKNPTRKSPKKSLTKSNGIAKDKPKNDSSTKKNDPSPRTSDVDDRLKPVLTLDPNTTIKVEELDPDAFERKLDGKERKHKCEKCNKMFVGKSDLRKHMLIHDGIKPYSCQHCGKKFRQTGNLKNHITSYHSNMIENPVVYVCDYCNKTFLIKERLRLHIRVHMNIKPYPCKYCPMKFARLGQLKQHTRVHTGERKYHCSSCGASFTCGGKLKLHMKSHFNIREYTCDLCGKRFLRPDGMQKHLKCFHRNEKPFKCTICNKMLKGHLQEHLRTHEAARPHGCSDCGSRFAQRSQLVVHQRMHSGAKPYRCRVCWRAFSYSTALKLHIRRHTGEKPFKCPLCDATFFQLPHMKKHVNCIHGELRTYCHHACGALFKMKYELDQHIGVCEKSDDQNKTLSIEEELSQQVADAYKPVEPPMALTKMRLLVAVLLKKISSTKKLEELGFNKRLIDDILAESLELSGHTPSKDESLSPAERLRYNVQLLLDWTVPSHFMEQFREERRSTEELLEELTS